ncbi:MAG: MFS transporter [Muribaculaceae bacterium]|nr:MFS transporter [Muribaculaceae bacterium]
MSALKVKLAVMNFLEFAVWGAYLTSLGIYLADAGLGDKIYWFYTVQGIVSIFMPAIIGIVADRWIQAQRTLSLCHLIAGLFMCAGAYYCYQASSPEFGPLFALYTISVAFFMPTIGLANSVAYTALNKAGLDTVKHFPPIRVFGTVGFIASMLLTNFLTIDGVSMQKTYFQLLSSGIFSLILMAYALTMPKCPTSKGNASSVADAFGLKAFALFKERKMAIFFIFSMLLGVSLQITNSYGTTFIAAFTQIAEYADTWGAKNATALISLSQMSETLCILLIPFCLKRFGIKGVMTIAMLGWVLRFGFFGLGNPGSGVWLFVLSMIVYGVAFDFFNISGSLYVDKQTDPSVRSSAQGLFMLMTNGVGATFGTLAAGAVVNHYVFRPDITPTEAIAGWHTSWYIFAAYALAVAILFWLIFRDDEKPRITIDTAVDDDVVL